MKLSVIRSTLQEIHVSPVKTLGQNFLHDQNLARWIVDRAQVTSGDYVLEIGPGLGALTKFLLEKGARAILKFFPGWGNVVCGVVAGSGTYAIGRAATAYFIEGVSLKDARRTYLKSRKKRRRRELEEAQ